MMKHIIETVIKSLDFSKFVKKQEKKPSVLRDLLDDPDSFVLTAMVDDGEIKISIKKRESRD